ncbi:MAG TPA: HNH endonuclease signature motif containing protein [Blastococcus sp.]|nr:HNH endonuclease signature motif containing protein [Blastococcus sp.]
MFDGEPPRSPQEGVPIPVRPPEPDPGASDLELVADIWAADAREARHAADRAASIAALARRRSIQRDRDFGPLAGPGLDNRARRSPVLAQVSDTFVAELALIRGCTETEAEALAVESILLTTTLTGTWEALHAGRIDVRKMRALIDLLAPARPAVITQIEARVLPHADRLTVPQLRARIRRALARLDADALDRRRAEAARRADVTSRPTAEGMSQVTIDLPLFQAAACVDAIDQHARLLRAGGDQRPIGVLRAAVAADLILRPWDTSRPPVTAHVTVHVPLAALHPPAAGAPPAPAGEIAGTVVTATQCRDVLRELDMLGLRAAPPGGSVHIALSDPATGHLIAVTTRTGLHRAAGHHRRRRRPRPQTIAGAAGTRPLDTTTTDTTAADGPGLRPPPPTTGYRPTAAQKRFVQTRDRHCRMPGCRARPGRCDLDHGTAHADGGPTDCQNLCCLCRRHHRIKTFARDWHFHLLPDGRLIVRTPSGISRLTRPPGWCHEPEPDPPWLDEQAPPDPQRH